MAYNRCSICNATNSPEITLHAEDFHRGIQFSHDPRDHGSLICEECYNDIYPEEYKTWEEQALEEEEEDETWDE